MAYTVLARRYRSTTFDEVVGQAHIAQTLKKAITSGRVAHAYLFCGTRGVGKTSMARILAKALNCHRSDGPTPEPCGECDSCKGIARGDDIDVIEIDAASNTGVDNIRDLIENSQYRPARGRLKIYIIDEVHMLSKNAFNALLKTLEEPPEHVKFILATTEPEKVLATILSRCQRYDFRNIPTKEIAAHLRCICQGEAIEADDDALLLVAKSGAGSMRDALSLLDRLLSVGGKHLTGEMVEQLLGLPRSQLLFDLTDAIGRGAVGDALGRADAMINAGQSPEMLVAALVDHLRNLLILRACDGPTDLVEAPGLSESAMLEQARRFDAIALTQDIILLEDLRRRLRSTQAGRALLDATLVRLALAEQFMGVGELLMRIDAEPSDEKKNARVNEAAGGAATMIGGATTMIGGATAATGGGGRSAQGSSALVDAGAGSASIGSSASSPVEAAPSDWADGMDDSGGDDLPGVGRVWEGDSPGTRALLKPRFSRGSASAGAPVNGAPSASANPASVDPGNPSSVWNGVLAALLTEAPGIHAWAVNGRDQGIRDHVAIVTFPAANASSVKALERGDKKERLCDTLCRVLGQTVGLRLELAEPSPDGGPNSVPAGQGAATPAAPTMAPTSASPSPAMPAGPASLPLTAELRAELDADPLIHAVLKTLGGNIVKVTEA